MLDNEFLKSLGIKTEEVLPTPEANGNYIDEEELSAAYPPLEGEFMVPPGTWELGGEELKKVIEEGLIENPPLKYRTPRGHVIAIYPYSDEQEVKMLTKMLTLAELLVLLGLIKMLEAELMPNKPHDGPRVSTYEF
jgi:hypothetical protein